jgi:Tol biopolymer transport system component
MVGVVAGLVPATAEAAFPGSNGRLAYYLFSRYPYAIHTLAPDGTDDTQLRMDRKTETDPNWSADGSRIVFVRNANTTPGTQLATMAADGTDLQVIARDAVLPPNPEAPAWSPNASMIAFCAYGRHGDKKIFVIGVDGSGLTNISGADNEDCYPAWSPDGTRIALTNFGNNGISHGGDIVTMDPDGTNRTTLVSGTFTNLWPDWSPDGTRIVFIREFSRTMQIFLVDAAGGPSTKLTDTRRFKQYPSWSPDGTAIAYCKSRSPIFDPCDILTIAPDGTGVTRITDTKQRDESHPDWQPLP